MTIKFSEAISEKTKQRMEYVKENEKNLQPGVVTVTVRKDNDFLSSAVRAGSDLVWYSDETRERGGLGKGPSPLSYFMSSMGLCQMVHYAEHSMVDNIPLDSVEIRIDGKFSMQRPRRFTEVSYEVKIQSTASEDSVKKLARASADDCYVTGTLKSACPVTGVVIHNGRKIDRHR